MICNQNLDLLNKWKESLCHLPNANSAFQPSQHSSSTEIYDWAANCDLDQDDLNKSLADVLNLRWEKSLTVFDPSAEFIDRYPISLARDKSVLGFEKQNGVMPVAIGQFESYKQLDVLARRFDCELDPFFASNQQIQVAVNSAYERRESQTVETIEDLDTGEALLSISQSGNREDLLDSGGRSPVVRLVNSILFDAAQNRASDIHIQPYEEDLQVRFRIDGVLFDQFKIPKASQEEVLSRIKVIGEMNIAEKRLPQDGRASVQIGDRMIDLRIASLPTSFGERIVIRLLDKSARLYTLEELGMPGRILESFRKLIHLEHGLILVTGPTGGGKSTTLYAGLQEINTKYSNVVTLEDPIGVPVAGDQSNSSQRKEGTDFRRGFEKCPSARSRHHHGG